jgi:hypothetical protein
MNSELADAAPDRRSSALVDREAKNSFLRWGVHVLLPVGLSVLLHLVLFGSTSFVFFQAARQEPIEVGPYEAGIVNAPQVAGELSFETEAVFEAEDEPLNLDDLSFSDIAPPTDIAIPETTDPEALDTGQFGLGSGTGGGLLGTGGGAGAAGTGGFGSGMGSGQRFDLVGVWDLKVVANRIVYVVDFSGSIVTVVDDLRRELKRSVGRLRAGQAFNVVIFFGEHNRTTTLSFASDLIPATAENKKTFIEWIDTKPPRGGTEPLDAMRRAIAQRPEAIFFFSDGRFRPEVVEQVTRANRNDAQIACLLFDELVFEDASGLPPGVDEQARLLQRLAEQNRGKSRKAAFKIVTLKDL